MMTEDNKGTEKKPSEECLYHTVQYMYFSIRRAYHASITSPNAPKNASHTIVQDEEAQEQEKQRKNPFDTRKRDFNLRLQLV